jgi:hypothetical protein
MENNTRLLFLDLDGVLVPFKPLTVWTVPTDWVEFSHNGMRETFAKLSKSCVEQLNRITDTTGAKIVLSTAWREYFISCYESHPRPEMAVFLAYLKHCGIKADIIGWTPHGDDADSKGVRGVEIRKFIYRYLLKGKQYESMVILDDRDDMEEFTQYLVQTEPYQGITEEIANIAIRILNGEV